MVFIIPIEEMNPAVDVEMEKIIGETMYPKMYSALICVFVFCCFLTAPVVAQTEWTEHPDNPLMTLSTNYRLVNILLPREKCYI